jgi:hypothetical protein
MHDKLRLARADRVPAAAEDCGSSEVFAALSSAEEHEALCPDLPHSQEQLRDLTEMRRRCAEAAEARAAAGKRIKSKAAKIAQIKSGSKPAATVATHARNQASPRPVCDERSVSVICHSALSQCSLSGLFLSALCAHSLMLADGGRAERSALGQQ